MGIYRGDGGTGTGNQADVAEIVGYRDEAQAAAAAALVSANNASSSETAAENAQLAAEAAQTATETVYDNFDDRYLGAKSSDPTVDNDGNALIVGALYWNSVANVMKVWSGSAWATSYAPAGSYLERANNLSDLANVSTARTNLGLGTAATTAATDYATAVQGANADTAFGWGNHASAGYAQDSAVVKLSGDQTVAGTKTFSSTIGGSISGTAANVTGTVAVANGGTGLTTLTANNVILGNGTSAPTFVAPGSSGNVLTSNGTTWTSSAPSATYKEIQPLSASVSSNALTLTLNATTLDFRSTTLTSGTINTRTVSSPISVVVSSGSTLGTINNVAARLVVIAIDNAGTVELAVVNIKGGNNLDETTLISTTAEGGAGAADSVNTIYSTTARTNVPFRVVGFVDITQATAGTWASAPTLVQGYGGQAGAAMQSLGYSQTWQEVSGSRAFGTTYYNTTGRPISVRVEANSSTSGQLQIVTDINGVTVTNPNWYVAANNFRYAETFIVPPGASYVCTLGSSSGSPTLSRWNELR